MAVVPVDFDGMPAVIHGRKVGNDRFRRRVDDVAGVPDVSEAAVTTDAQPTFLGTVVGAGLSLPLIVCSRVMSAFGIGGEAGSPVMSNT